jgi:3-isopropylmalate dehydratase small subunit
MDLIQGKAWVFGDNLNTDIIHPPQYFSLDPATVKQGLFSGLDPQLQDKLSPGDIIFAGKNFGCGSSRETSIRSLKLNQIGAIVAVDFARIFFRNATNNALPCICFRNPMDLNKIVPGQTVEISPSSWTLSLTNGETIALEPVGSFISQIWEAGGLLNLLQNSKNEQSI